MSYPSPRLGERRMSDEIVDLPDHDDEDDEERYGGYSEQYCPPDEEYHDPMEDDVIEDYDNFVVVAPNQK